MAHFAQLDANNVVTQVIVVSNDVINNEPFPQSEAAGITFCQSLYGADTIWKQTSYNNKIRKRYAGVGYTYDETLDAFISPKPYPSWTLDNTTTEWVAPVSMPTDGKFYVWNEETKSWDINPQQPALTSTQIAALSSTQIGGLTN